MTKKIKVLWISSDPIRSRIIKGISNSGHMKEALLKILASNNNLEIVVAYPRIKIVNNVSNGIQFNFPSKKFYKTIPDETLQDLLRIIKLESPDVIHIHGVERPFGLIANFTKIPIFITLQGFISECATQMLGGISKYQFYKYITLKEVIKRNSFLDQMRYFQEGSISEISVLKSNNNFGGRTSFDNKILNKYNSKARYFEAFEALRDEFYNKKWTFKPENKYVIYTPSFENPYKGFHVLLSAVAILKNEFKTIKIIVPGSINLKKLNILFGSSYVRYLYSIIKKNNLENNVEFLGNLDAEGVSRALLNAHVFVMPSLIENSSNALGEALIMGVPSIVANPCGGNDSIVSDEVNCLFFENRNSKSLANKIETIFKDDNLASTISVSAIDRGNFLHNKNKIYKQYSDIYEELSNLKS